MAVYYKKPVSTILSGKIIYKNLLPSLDAPGAELETEPLYWKCGSWFWHRLCIRICFWEAADQDLRPRRIQT